MAKPTDYPDAINFQNKHIRNIEEHMSGAIFPAEPLSGLEGTALEEASKVKDIAEKHGFKVSEAKGKGPIMRVIIGEEHGVAGEEEFLKYHSQIAGIVKDMVSEGLFGEGDELCYEEAHIGEVDYEKSHGTTLVVGGQKFKAPEKAYLVQLLDVLKDNKIKAVCNDHELRKIVLSMEERVDRFSSQGKVEEAYLVSLERDTVLLLRVEQGMAKYLAEEVEKDKKAVQIMGTTDVFTGKVQERLEKENIPYIVLMPVLR